MSLDCLFVVISFAKTICLLQVNVKIDKNEIRNSLPDLMNSIKVDKGCYFGLKRKVIYE